jgi:hypothetical protein
METAMKLKPTQEQAIEAEEALSNAIQKFAGEDATWVPRPSTLRYGRLRDSGYIWTMDANDPQIVAYYVTKDGNSFVQVTAHGQARATFREMLRQKHLFPSSIWEYYYDFRKQFELDDEMRKKVAW